MALTDGTEVVTNCPPYRYERALTVNAKHILKAAFAVEDRAGRKQARKALAWLINVITQKL